MDTLIPNGEYAEVLGHKIRLSDDGKIENPK